MRRHWLQLPVLAAATGTLAAALSAAPALASTTTNALSGPSSTLTISNESGGLWSCAFNPLGPNGMRGEAFGFSYEPLMYVNPLENGKVTPMLATSYAWSNGNKQLTFTIRKGVKWSDGQPFSAADVVYTYNLIKKYPALDLYAVWSVLKGVRQAGDKVVLSFKQPAVPYFYYLADEQAVVPQHIWAHLKNPVTYVDPKPVGTGPYLVSQCTGQNITYTANPTFWKRGWPKVKTVMYPAFTSNAPANQYLGSGRAQWGGQFIPDQKVLYLDKSPNNHFWYPGIENVYLFINLTKAPLNDVAVRQAMAYAINRPRVALIGEYGYEPAANQTGIVTPAFSSWLDKPLAAKYGGNYAYNPAKAISILEKDGYKKGPGGVFEKGGKPLSFTLVNSGGNSDWVASVQVIQQELAAVGIQIKPLNLTGSSYSNDLDNGKYQLAYGNEHGGPSPYYEMRALLYGPNSAPIGQAASSDYERYNNPAINQLFQRYASITQPAAQHQIIDQFQKVMLSDVPSIPINQNVDWFQYNTAAFSGWPTPQNPYAQPAPYNNPDVEQVLLHLVPKG